MATEPKTKPGKNITTEEPGLTPAPDAEDRPAAPGSPTAEAERQVAAEADPDRTYLVLVADERHDRDAWIELGSVSAPTKTEAWAKAKDEWAADLVPTMPTGPDAPAATIRAKLIPLRYARTIESTMEYVAPRNVVRGL
jgi:hypothetical protein